jgi:dipeptidyl aminopeptidase/acylaminoacyl peptidase
MPVLLALALAGTPTVVPTAPTMSPEADPCAVFDTLPQRGKDSAMWTTRDQISMADIGSSSSLREADLVGISPDGTRAAFLILRANPDLNAYCHKLMVAPVDGEGSAVEVSRGGEYIRDAYPLREFTAIYRGWSQPVIPRWSPDGSMIAFLRREKDSTQVWLADPSGRTPPTQASALPEDAEDLAWSADSAGLVVSSRPGLRRKAEEIEQEGRGGFLFDNRFSPQFADRPIPIGNVAVEYSWLSLADRATRVATPAEQELLAPARPAFAPTIARGLTTGPDGYSAWLEPKHPERLLSPTRIVMAGPDGERNICESADCEGVISLKWSREAKALFIVQRMGWARSRMALLRWNIGAARPALVTSSEDMFTGCTPSGVELVCGREGSSQPRRIVAINMMSGAERLIHDPNPIFDTVRTGQVQRLRFRLSSGVESYADLVFPPDHKPGEKHPLVVVQYRSRGFLRGGIGDEVPIHPLSRRGFVVLSFDRPDFPPEAQLATTEAEIRTLSEADWADRRHVHEALETAIELAIATGAVDAERMGISGFSDGTSTVQYALINSDLFKVASIGACCEDMYSFALAAGPYFTEYLRKMGYRYFDPGMATYWQPMSLILNVDRVDEPILIQTGDSEYEGALDVVEVYKHNRRAIEMFVFPGEPHNKWQPAHKQAIYDRSAEWFEFWLMGRVNCSQDRAAQYERWRAMPGAPAEAEQTCVNPG